MSGEELFIELALEDLRRAADLFRPVHRRDRRLDGWVSMEVSPLLAADTAGTHRSGASRFTRRRERANLFVKIPGTPEGVPAIEEAIFAGIPVNVTLLFSREQYLAAARPTCAASSGASQPGSIRGGLGGLAVHQPLGQGRDGQGAGGAAQSAWHRDRPATYRAYRELLASPRWQKLAARRRAAAAPAVGEHRHQGPARIRHAVHRGARRARHDQHHAREDAARIRRPRQARTARWRPTAATAEAVLARFSAGRRRHRRAGAQLQREGAAVVRQVVAANCCSGIADKAAHSTERSRAMTRSRCRRATPHLDARRPAVAGAAASISPTHRADMHLRELFADDPRRGERLTVEAAGLYLDYSKNRVTDETLRCCCELAEECGLPRAHRGDVPRRARSTPPKIARCCTSRCARRAASTSSSTATTSCRTCTRCSIAWRPSPSECAAARGAATPASASATSSTSASAAPISAR